VTKYKTSLDLNGNKVVRITFPNGRNLSIQTNGNLPETHRKGVCQATDKEVKTYVLSYGTKRQKALVTN